MEDAPVRPRRFERYSTDLEVLIHQEPSPVRGRIVQLSRGGCLIFPALPPLSDPHIQMSFRLSEDLPSIDCTGEIIYNIEAKGTGVALMEISELNQEMISEFFEKTLRA